MSQPPAYSMSFNFTDWAASNPSLPLPGAAVDVEFGAIKATFAATLANLAKIQRDDGALLNQLVTLDTLSPAVLVLFGASAQWTPRGAWATATAYAVSDVIQSGTATYVCAIAHTSAVALATDIAAHRWVLIFDSAGATPADGSVSTAKLADGAITTAKIGFTSLDLSGSVRAATGIQAGTGGPTGLMHAKLLTGDASMKSERGAKATGTVGYRWIGGTLGLDWYATVAATSDDLVFGNSSVGTAMRLRANGQADAGGHLRTTGTSATPLGVGVGMSFASSVGFLDSYDYDNTAWKDLKLRGAIVYLSASAVDVVKVTSTGMDVTGAAQRGGVDLGWLDLPQNAESTAYGLVLADRGKHIYSTNVAGQAITIPLNATVAFPFGTAIAIVNDGTNPITVTITGGVTLKQAGTTNTGNRTLAANGVATLLKVGTDRWFISGAGIS